MRPNVLVFMVDQLTGTLFPDGPAPFLCVPNLAALAARSTRFANAYCPSPLCAPARASVMAGQMPHRTGVYDNAAEFASSIPTYAHHLRRAGYATTLCGKMHFVGPDQLHGFEERLTTDIYPADFAWTPDWRRPGERIDWWYHNMGSVTGAGVAEITNQLEYDDEVAYEATRKVYDLGRRRDARPWMMTVSFTHPHDPYVARRRHWDLYEGSGHLLPAVPAIPYERHDGHSRRIFDANDWRSYDVTERNIADARRAYFANISYVDEKVGEVMTALDATGQADDTIVAFLSDHGEMLGERGLWYKMNFFEGSARVPLMIAAPELPVGRVDTPVSTIDLSPTLAALVGIDLAEVTPWTEGVNLIPVAAGADRGPVTMEYAAEASEAPIVALRIGSYKYVSCVLDPPLLFDLAADPHELRNLAGDPSFADVEAAMAAEVAARWDLAAFDDDVRESQARRRVVWDALKAGAEFPWDFQPLKKASERYVRNRLDLDALEATQRWPRAQ